MHELFAPDILSSIRTDYTESSSIQIIAEENVLLSAPKWVSLYILLVVFSGVKRENYLT